MSAPHSDEVLELSVHSLPKPGDDSGQLLLASRLKLLAIVFACSLPALLAYFAYYVVRPQGDASFGELISPVRVMPVVQASNLDGLPVPLPSLKAQWLLVKVGGGACVKDCQKQLLMLRQFRLMLGKDMDRVDWVWFVDDQAPVDPVLRQRLNNDQATVLRLDAHTIQTWLTVPEGQSVQDYFFVIDPMGNAMMRLPARFDSAGAAKAKRDMDRLLRASLPWDPPGR
jgi:hypothetical protein